MTSHFDIANARIIFENGCVANVTRQPDFNETNA